MSIVEDYQKALKKFIAAKKTGRGYPKAKQDLQGVRAAWKAAGRPGTPNGPGDAISKPPTTKSKPRMRKGN